MMKKQLVSFMAISMLFTGGCKSKEAESTYTGPIVETDTRTDQEKELAMIQSCIESYNQQKIEEIEETLNTTIPALPIGISSLPEIQSLNDLTVVTDDPEDTNTSYIGTYNIGGPLRATFYIYKPSGGSFWLNGKISFNINPDDVQSDNPEYSTTKSELDSLLSEDTDILNWLYGINVELGSSEVEPGYYPVLRMGAYTPTTIDEIKGIAENVFMHDFLQEVYYPASFESDTAIFKEIDGQLCCIQTELTERPEMQFDTSKIYAVYDDGNTISVNLLYSIFGNLQTEIKTIRMVKTENGLRLPKNYG